VNALPKRFTASDRLQNFAHEKSMKLINSIISDNSMNQLLNDNTCDIVSQDTLDGLRLTMANHEIIHLRPSGNAPELRCYVETDSELRSNCLIKSIIKAVEQTQL
jgi:phosphomannomutase